MKKLATEKNVNILIFVLLVIQPFLEIYWLYHFDAINNLFVLSPSTVIRLFAFLLLLVIFIIDKKKYKGFIILSSVFLIYSLMHHVFASNTKLYWSDSYSFIKEMFYIMRLAIPLYLIYILSFFKIENKTIESGFYISAYIFAGIMIITNIFMIAMPAYPYTDTVEGSIFGWFTAKQNGIFFEELATKGIFNSANQISGFLILIFPILVYYLYKKFSIVKVVGIIITIISMLMLGTRVASWGLFIVMIIMLGIYVFLGLVKKEQIEKNLIVANVLILLFAGTLFMFSPLQLRSSQVKEPSGEVENIKVQMKIYLKFISGGNYFEKLDEIAGFVREVNWEFSVPTIFLDIYLPEEDPGFWLRYYLNTDYTKIGDYRNIQGAIMNATNNKYGELKTCLFGFSHSATFDNGMYLERDIIVQVFYVGIIGALIFIGPFIGVIVYSIYRVLKEREQFNFENLTYILALGLTICVSLFSGNMLDIFIVTIPFAIISSLLINNLKTKKV